MLFENKEFGFGCPLHVSWRYAKRACLDPQFWVAYFSGYFLFLFFPSFSSFPAPAPLNISDFALMVEVK